ncbi:MAG: hypothetical protein ABFQ95_05015 [Pseudomonadota bacterium]
MSQIKNLSLGAWDCGIELIGGIKLTGNFINNSQLTFQAGKYTVGGTYSAIKGASTTILAGVHMSYSDINNLGEIISGSETSPVNLTVIHRSDVTRLGHVVVHGDLTFNVGVGVNVEILKAYAVCTNVFVNRDINLLDLSFDLDLDLDLGAVATYVGPDAEERKLDVMPATDFACGLFALVSDLYGTDDSPRGVVCDELLKNSGNEFVRRLAAPDIVNGIMRAEMAFAGFDQALARYYRVSERSNRFSARLQNAVGAGSLSPQELLASGLLNDEQRKTLEDLLKQIEAAKAILLDIASREAVFLSYIEHYVSQPYHMLTFLRSFGAGDSTSIMDSIAYVYELQFALYHANGNRLELLHQFPENFDPNLPVIEILHNGVNHYDRLVPA